MSKLRPDLQPRHTNNYCPDPETAYLMVYNAVKSKTVLIHGRTHGWGESCAIGSYFDVNPKNLIPSALVDEIAAVNDSIPNGSGTQRRTVVLRWLRWKLGTIGMPGFLNAPSPGK